MIKYLHMSVTVIIHSLNEEKNIDRCIRSAKLLTNKIILIDMASKDKTVEIAKSLNVTVFNFPQSNYVEPAREFGIKQAETDWVLILDADERITKELASEIKIIVNGQLLIVKNNQQFSYFKIPRRNIFAGVKWLKHGGWWPDYQIRLINKKHFIEWPKRIHATPIIKGQLGYLKSPITHYFHGNLSGMVKKTVVFENIESELLFNAKKTSGTGIFFRKYLAELYRRLIKNLGFLDGTFGVIESMYQAFSKTITYLFLYEKQRAGKVAFYDPYLDTLGGGEKHILSIMDVFAEQGYEVNIFWDKDLSKEISNRFSLQSIKRLKWIKKQNLKKLSGFDYFFYVTDGSYFFSQAKNNFVFSMVPNQKLYNLNLLNRLKLWNYKFISNSPFTTKWLNKWNINPATIPPYIDSELLSKTKIQKEKIILSVGRFFSQLHSKNQAEIITTFKELKKRSKEYKDYKLILAGGLLNEDNEYFNTLKKLSEDDKSIEFKTNIPLYELYKLYELSRYFWHFTGLGVDEKINPENVEHFGIAPLEAMASGCLTFCYSAGGPKELVVDGENGFLFTDTDQLIDKMIEIDLNKSQQEKIISNGRMFVKEKFSYEIFRSKVLKLL